MAAASEDTAAAVAERATNEPVPASSVEMLPVAAASEDVVEESASSAET